MIHATGPGRDLDAVAGRDYTPPASEEEYRRQVGHRARLRRVDLRLNQNEIAAKAGVSRNFVSAIERGTQGLDTWRLRRLADALDVTFGWLLGEPDAPAGHRTT